MPAEVIQSVGDDETIAKAARVSFLKDQIDGLATDGLVRFLMREKHMSPFEHNSITFRIEAPIFVWREFMRHRTLSYNEQSGRYTEFKPEFYAINGERPVVQKGKTGDYSFEQDVELNALAYIQSERAYEWSWSIYCDLLRQGVAKEVARNVLPVATYSAAYVTGNLRNWLQFLELRTSDQAQHEIREVARNIEEAIAGLFPIAHSAWKENQ